MNVRTILVPVDLGGCSQMLVDEAAGLARALAAELRLIHVAQLPSGLSAQAVMQTAQGPVPVSTALIQEAERGLAALDTGGVPCVRGARLGSPVPQILAATQELGADLVVLGTHGRQGLAQLVLGSVAERVVRHSAVPVLTIRTGHGVACEPGVRPWEASSAGPASAQAAVEADG